MQTQEKTTLTTTANIQAPVEQVWQYWTEPRHITQWNHASDDWHTPRADNNLKVGGKYLARMEAKDGSFGFDFEGIYDEVTPFERIVYTIADGRQVQINFQEQGNSTSVTQSFEAENTHPLELQQQGWQSILDNFKKYAESRQKSPKLHYSIEVEAPAEKVYRNMLNEETYKEWTAAFNETSRYEGSWEKGSEILFLGTDQHGKSGGMVSRIRENIPARYVSIEHLGLYGDGKEITSGEAIEGWAGAQENYKFTSKGNKTLLSVDLDSNPDFESYFQETWPKALKILKTICER